MSLKFFHIVFVTITTLLSFACAAWEYNNYRAYDGLHYVGALVSAVFGATMIAYGFWFWKKAKRLIL
jgi:hypothetical protein